MIAIALAFIADGFFADPNYALHPVRLIGRLIEVLQVRLEGRFKGIFDYFAGGLLAVLTVGVAFLGSHLLIFYSFRLHPALAVVIEVFLIYSAMSPKEMFLRVNEVLKEIDLKDLGQARLVLSEMVGRDTGSLSLDGCLRALIETTAENITDGSIAPLFYAAIGGAPLAMAYRAVNTLDSTVGYRNERYLRFGFFAAKLDDLANYIPARISALLMILVSPFFGLDWKSGFKTLIEDGKKHLSPNAGLTEAAAAGLFNLTLGGPSRYGGKVVHKATLGKGQVQPSTKIAYVCARLHYLVAIFAALIFAPLRWAIIAGGLP